MSPQQTSGSAKKLAIIGCGTMGQCILTGLLRAAAYKPDEIVASVRREEAAERLVGEFPGTRFTLDNHEAISTASLIILCLKPHLLREYLEANGRLFAGKAVISIAAGVTLGQLTAMMPDAGLVLRAMPNTPCRIGEGMTAIAFAPSADSKEAKSIGRAIFEAVGRVVFVEDRLMDVVTALSGSGPAFACVIMEALADGAVMMGLPRSTAIELAAQMLQGAARMVLQTNTHPAALKDSVSTPAGCTIAGLLVMEDGRIRSVLARTIEEASKVASTRGQSKPSAAGNE